jgi:cell wall-associated protease
MVINFNPFKPKNHFNLSNLWLNNSNYTVILDHIIINLLSMKFIYSPLLILLFFISCKSTKEAYTSYTYLTPQKKLSPLALQTWYQKDYQQDTIPGISLEKWYSQNKKKPINNDIIIAIIDTQIGVKHVDLDGHIWT